MLLQDAKVCWICSPHGLHVLISSAFSKDCSDSMVRTSVDCK